MAAEGTVAVGGAADAKLDARRVAWPPPPRPAWVSAVNAEGEAFDLASVVPLDEQSLLDAARARTGLDDFGGDDWYESFRIFVRALNEEAALNLMGRLMTRSDLVNILAARLQIEETYRRHPEIDAEEIRSPIMIVGQARTGTTLLLELLSLDPDNGSLKHWECMFPCPPPEKAGYETDPRIEAAERLVMQWDRVNPELAACHVFNARVPTEASHAMTLSFSGGPYLALLGQTPMHAAFMRREGPGRALRYQRRLLKLLQWKNPRKTWILKAPDAILYMPELLQVYPDMKFVWTHRDPLKAADSVVNMYGNCMWVRSDQPIVGGVLEQMLNADLAAALLNQPIEWIEQGVVPKASVCNIRFLELEADPLPEIKRLYTQFGMHLSAAAEQAIRGHLAANPRTARAPSKYRVHQDAESGAERARLKRYQDYFGVHSEF